MAKAAGLSMGEYLRRAAASFRPSEDDRMLEGMIDQMNKTSAQANAAIDKALVYVESSNKRIVALEIALSRSGGEKPVRQIGHKG